MDDDNDYTARLKAGPALEVGTLVEMIEPNCDAPIGLRGVVTGDASAEYDWPVYKVEWMDQEPGDNHVASAFCKVILEPQAFLSATDVERFLNDE